MAEEIEEDEKDFNGRFFLEVLKSGNWRGFEGLIGCLIIAISGQSAVFAYRIQVCNAVFF